MLFRVETVGNRNQVKWGSRSPYGSMQPLLNYFGHFLASLQLVFGARLRRYCCAVQMSPSKRLRISIYDLHHTMCRCLGTVVLPSVTLWCLSLN